MGFSFSAEDILSNVNEKTSLIIINSPANPTGGIIPEKELKRTNDPQKDIKENIYKSFHRINNTQIYIKKTLK